MNVNSEFRDLFDEVGNDPAAWIVKALALFQSADILRDSSSDTSKNSNDEMNALHQMNMQQVFIMLRGMGVECLLKAAWAKHVKPLAVEGNYQKPVSANPHDLVRLEASLDEKIRTGLSQEERMVLARLSKQIVAGRYPIETKVGKSPALPPGGGVPYFMRWTKEDEHDFQAILGKLITLSGEDS